MANGVTLAIATELLESTAGTRGRRLSRHHVVSADFFYPVL